ncbi:copper chaperone PCu(A)C [Aurantiacibacter gangjinensis]|uniref:Uncharacterized protein n=1 Tax=Aurantiacibacter gangjinensis TaxID=502682 RepID=A0A0G9MU80_9SPHN|nr:copper chaperone PCu(A)C [Aurantiacibacter gangjinensis]APE28753.1 putative exported protein [Aurantiacibacter gangjinensis]KLE32908.1 hypothetical protein AAW01_02515 [Aurantiacibacter gangjinensis]
MNKKTILAAAPVLGTALALAACAEETAEPVVENTDCVEGIQVTDGWLASPAIPGDPAAVYFTIENTSDRNRMISGADVLGASSAMLHQTSEWNYEASMSELMQLDVPAGETIEFNPETYHVMAMDTDPTLEVGAETETTLTFVGGDKCSFPVEIRAAGDAPGADEEAGS